MGDKLNDNAGNSNAVINDEQRARLFESVRKKLGAPIVKVEISDEMMESYYYDALDEVSSVMNDWLTKEQWSNLSGISMSRGDLLFALTTKGTDWEYSFTYAYSKQVGMDESGTYELKKDYFTIEPDRQVYNIPANREINEVLWYANISPIEKGRFMSHGSYGDFFGDGYSGWTYGNTRMNFMLPLYGVLAGAQHAKMADKIRNSEMTYRITGGPNGTKNIHLYPTPFGDNTSSMTYINRCSGYQVWYWYYETDGDRDKCLEENDDIARLPSDVKIKTIRWGKFNESFQSKVRRLLIAKCKQVLGLIRGKFSGELNLGDAQRSMDYRMLLDEGQREEEKIMEELREYMMNYTYVKIMEERASISENLNRILENQPFKRPIIMR